MPSAVGSAFAAAHRMGHRVHRLATDMRPKSHMTFATGFSDLDVLKIGIAQLSNGRPAFFAHPPHFSAGQNNRRPIPFFGHQPCNAAGRTDQFAALTGVHFNIMNLNAHRNRLKRHRIADLRFDQLLLSTVWFTPEPCGARI